MPQYLATCGTDDIRRIVSKIVERCWDDVDKRTGAWKHRQRVGDYLSFSG